MTNDKAALDAHTAREVAKALEEAAKVADGYHRSALDWSAARPAWFTKTVTETDSSRIAAAIRALIPEVKP